MCVLVRMGNGGGDAGYLNLLIDLTVGIRGFAWDHHGLPHETWGLGLVTIYHDSLPLVR